jgi:hypothetical protein
MVFCASDEKAATALGSLRFTDIQTRPTEILDLTRLILDEFQLLVPPFEVAFAAHMAEWRLDGRPRTARRYTTSTKLSVTHARGSAAVYARLPEDVSPPSGAGAAVRDGAEQSASHQWIHVLLVVLRAPLRTLGDAPTRPEPSQPRPEHPIGRPETRAINGLLVDRQLMPQGQVFQAQ